MGSTTWNGGSGGWGTIANWSEGIPDSAADAAYITTYGTYTVTLEAGQSDALSALYLDAGGAVTLDVLGTLNLADGELYLYAGTLDLGGTIEGGAVQIAGGQTLADDGGTLTGAVFAYLNSDLYLNGHILQLASGAVRGGVSGGGTLDITGDVAVGGLYLDAGTEVLVTGTALDDGYNTRLDDNNGTAASILSITSTGTYAVNNPDAGMDYYGPIGTVINAGLFENISTAASYYDLSDDFTNTGSGILEAVSLVSALDSNFNPGDPNFSLYGAENYLGGTVTGAGQILLGGGYTTLAADAVVDPGLFAIGYDAATLGLTADRGFATPFNLNGNGTVDLDGETLALSDTGDLNGGIYGPGRLDVSGTYNVGGLQLGSGITEILSGTEIQTSETRLDADGGTTVATVLSITGMGIYDLVSDSQIDNYYYYQGYGTIINAGLFEKTGYNGASNIYADVTNTGAGRISIAADNALSLFGLTNNLAGTISGAGELYFGDNGGINLVTLEAGLVLDTGELALENYNTQLLLESDRGFTGMFVDGGGATFNLEGHTLSLSGMADLDSYIQGPGRVRVTGQGDISGLQLTGGAVLADDGTITQDGGFYLGVNSGDSAVLSIGAGAVFDILNDTYISDNGANATIVNAGLFEKTADAGSSYIYAPFVNTGTLAVTQGALGLESGGTLAGTLTGAGELYLGGGGFTLAENAVVNLGEFNINGGALTLSSDTSLSDVFALTGGALDLNGHSFALDNPGDDFSGAYVYGPGTLSESGRADFSGMNIGDGAVLNDAGTLTQDGNINLGLANTDTAALNIARSASYVLLNDSQIGTNGAASTINNAGLFEKLADNGNSYIYAAFNNLGGATLTVAHGDIALEDGGTLGGRIEGDGAINFQGGVSTLTPTAVIGIAAINLNGGTLALTSNRIFAQSFDETSGDLDLAGNNLTLGAADILQNADLTGPGTLSVKSATLENYYAGGGAEILDTGTISQTNGNLYLGFNSADGATLSVAAGAVYDFADDNGVYDYNGGAGTIFNAGLIGKTEDNGQSGSNAELINTGTLSAIRGSLDFSGGGVLAGTLTGAGQIELGGGLFSLTSAAVLNAAQFDLAGATLALAGDRSYSGIFSAGSGTLALDGASLALLGAAYLDNSYLDGAGTLTVNAPTELSGYNVSHGAMLVDASTITEDGDFNIGDFSGDTAGLSITSGAVFDLIGDQFIEGNGATASLANAGLFEKTGADGFSEVQGIVLVNTGVIDVAAGVLGFNTGGTLGGTVTGMGEIELYGGNFSLTAAAVLNVASLYLDGSALALENNRTYAGNFSDNYSTIALGGNALTLSGDVSFYGGDVAGPGTLALTGQARVNGAVIEDGATLLAATSITQDGNLSIGNATTDSSALVIAAGQTYQIIDDSSILGAYYGGPGAGSVVNAGLLQVTTDNGTSYVDYLNVTQSSTGTLAVTRGLLDLHSSNLFLAGTLTGAGEIEADYSDVTLAQGAALDVASLEFYGANTTLGGDFSFAGSMDLNGGTLALAGQALTLSDTANLDNIALAGPGTVLVTGQADINGAALEDGAVLIDAGTLTQNGDFQLGGNATDTSELTIASGAVFDMQSDNNINSAGMAAIVNAGLFEKTGAGTQGSYVEAGITNTGTLALTAGTLELRDLNNDGLVTISNGFLQLDSAVGGDANAPGHILLGPNAALDEKNGIAANQTVTLTGGHDLIEIGANSDFATGIAGFAASDVIDLQSTLANGYVYDGNNLTLTENGAAVYALLLPGMTAAGAFSLVADGNGGTDIEFGDSGSLTVPSFPAAADDWSTGSGNFDTSSYWSGGVPGAADTAVIVAGTDPKTITDSGDNTVFSLAFNDPGLTFSQTAGTLTSVDGGADENGLLLQSGGEILNESGILALTANGTLGGTLAGAGEIELGGPSGNGFGPVTLGAGAVLNVATLGQGFGGFIALAGDQHYAGLFTSVYSGGFDLNGHTLNLSGAAALNISDQVTGPGTLALSGTAAFSLLYVSGAAVLDVAGSVVSDQGLNLADSAALSIATTGIFDLTYNAGISANAGANVNAGLFEKTGADGQSTASMNYTQASTGTLDVASGVLALQNGNDMFAGLITGAGELELVNDNATLVPGVALNVAAFSLSGGTLSLTENRSLADAFAMSGNGTLALGANSLTLSGMSNLGNGNVSGTGTLRITGQAALSQFELQGSTQLLDASTITQDSGLTVGNAATGAAALIIGAGDVYDILDNSNIASQDDGGAGGNAIVNAGLFEKTGDDGTSGLYYVNYTQSSTGTLDAGAGLINFYDQDDSIAGTLAGAGEIQFQQANVTLAAGTMLDVASLELDGSDTTLTSSLSYGGAFGITAGGTLALNGFNLGLTGAASLGDQYVAGLGTINAIGATDINGLEIQYGAVLNDAATITQDGGFYIDGNGSLDSALLIGAGRAYDLLNASNIYGENGNGGFATLVNAGLLESTGSGGESTIQYVNVTQTSTGTLDAAQGELNFYGQSDVIAGTLTGAGEILFEYDHVTLAARTALNVASLELYGSNTTLSGDVAYAGAFNIAGGGTLALAGYDFSLSGAAALGGQYVSGAGTITVSAQADISGLDLEYGAALLDRGTITQDGNLQLGNIASDLDTLAIAQGAVFNLLNDSGIDSNFYNIYGATYGNSGTIENAGLFEKTADTGASYIYGEFDNAASGTLDIAQGVLYLNGGGQLAGRIAGAGELYVQNYANDAVTLAAGAVLSVAQLAVNGTLALAGERFYAGAFSDTGLLELNGYNFTLGGAASLYGDVQGGGTLSVTKTADINGLYLYQGAALQDLGSITQDGGLTMSNASTDSTALSIASGAVYDLLTDNSINANGPASILNAGLFEKDGDYGGSDIYPVFTNTSTGTIVAARGFLYFEAGGSFAGTLTGSADGTIAQGGIFESGGTMALAANAVVSAAEFGVTGGTLAFGGNLNYAGYFDAAGGAIALAGNTLSFGNGYLGSVYLAGPGTLAVTGAAQINGLNPGGGAVLIDAGTLTQNGYFTFGDSSTDAASLSIASAAVYDILNDNGIGASGAGAIINDGLFEKTADHGDSGIQASFTNNAHGIINAVSGELAFNGGGVFGGTLTGAGDIAFSNSADTLSSTLVSAAELEINGNAPVLGNNLTYGGFFSLDYGDTLLLDNHTLSLTGTADLIGGFDDPGTVVVAGSGTVDLLDLFGGTELIVTGSINQIDQLRFGLNDSSPGPSNLLSIAAGGTYNIQNDSPFEDWTPTATATNAGLLEKTGDTGTSQIQPNFTQTSTGTLSIASGVVQFYDQNDVLGGHVTGVGGIAFDYANVTLAPGLALDEASLALVSNNLTLTADQSYGGAFSLQGGTIDLNGFNLTLAGTASLGDLPAGYGYAVLNGPGTLVVAGTADINGMVLENGAALFDAGRITQEGAFTLGDSTADTASLGIGVSGVFVLINGNTLGADGSVSIDNAGLLQNSVSVSVTALTESYIQASTGTLAFAAGDLQFDGANNVLSGTVTSASQIDFESGTNVTLESSLALDAGTLNFDGGNVTLGAGQFYDGVLNAAGGTTELNGQTLTLSGTASLVENTVSGPGIAVISGTAEINGLGLENGAALLDAGSITQDGGFTLGDSATDSAALVIGAGGIYEMTDGNGIAGNGAGSITNAGLFEATGSPSIALFDTGLDGMAQVDAGFTQTGTGTLALPGPGIQFDGANNILGGTLTGAGEADFASGTNVTLAPALVLDTATLRLDGNATLSGDVSGSGGLVIGGDGALLGAGSLAVTVENDGLIEASGGTLALDGMVTGQGALVIAPGSELLLGPGSDIGENITFGGTAVLGLETQAPATLVSLTAGDTIDLIGSLATAAAIADGTLAVMLTTGGAEVFTLLNAATLVTAQLSPDGAGGSELVIAASTVFNLATASSVASLIDLGEVHLGGSLVSFVTLANLAAPGMESEGLDASFSGTTGDLSATGTITTLAAGLSNASALELDLTAAAGGLVSGSGTLDLTSDGAGIDTNVPSALVPDTITVTGTAFAYASPLLATTLINFGVVHVGDTATAALGVANLLTSADEEALDVSFSGTSGAASGQGGIARLAPGQSDDSSLIAGLATGTAGVISGAVTLALTSDGAGLDTLGSTGLVSQTIQLIGTVHNYATAALEQIGGAGSLTAVNATQYALDLGTLQQGSGQLTAHLGVLNAAPGLADLLSGGFTLSDPEGGFTNTGFASFSGLGAGQADTAPGITLSGADTGTFHELITLSSTARPAATLDVTGTVVSQAAPEFTLLYDSGSPGAAIHNGTLDLGTLYGSTFNFVFTTAGAGTVSGGGVTLWPSDIIELGLANTAAGTGAVLAGSFAVTGDAGFANFGLDDFSGLAAGDSLAGLDVRLIPSAPGHYAETITLYPSSGGSALAPEPLVIEAESALCFCAGTEILTPRGKLAVERLRIGDLVQTLHRGAQKVKWIGRRSYDGRFLEGRHLMLPVCLRAGALAPGLPVRDLWVSPGHGIWVGGMLVPAWRLINGVSVVQAPSVARVEYFHIELAGHEIVFAEHVPAESYFNETGRMQFQNGAEFLGLYGEVAQGAGLARTESGFGLGALRRRGVAGGFGPLRGFIDVAGPAQVSGWAQDAQAPEVPVCLDVLQGGRRVARVLANQYRADLREAGLGSGCHGFELALPAGQSGALEVRRAGDQAALARTEDASQAA